MPAEGPMSLAEPPVHGYEVCVLESQVGRRPEAISEYHCAADDWHAGAACLAEHSQPSMARLRRE